MKVILIIQIVIMSSLDASGPVKVGHWCGAVPGTCNWVFSPGGCITFKPYTKGLRVTTSCG